MKMKSISPQVYFRENKIVSEDTVLFQGVLKIKYLPFVDMHNETAIAYIEMFWLSSKVRLFQCQGQIGIDM